MSNEFLNLISSPLMNLDHTKRYSGTKLVEEETLSQHITDTIMMGIKIIDKINSLADREIVNPAEYLEKAVYHDLEECITGDIPRPLKYYDDDTLKSLRHVASQVAYKLFDKEFFDGRIQYYIWEESKSGDAGFILKIVDMLVVANKVIKEVSLLHNYYMLRVAQEVSQYLKDLCGCQYYKNPKVDEYIDQLLEGAIISMQKLIKDNSQIMRDLSICQQSIIEV